MAAFPTTVEALLDHMDRAFPEVRPTPTDTDVLVRHRLAERGVYLQLRDAFNLAAKRAG